jgi:hypothetical protein
MEVEIERDFEMEAVHDEPHRHALMLHALCNDLFLKYYGTSFPIVSRALTQFKMYLENTGRGGAELSDAMNTVLIEWYYGNFCNHIVTMVFTPNVILRRGLLYTTCMSKTQVHDALITLYDLMIGHGLHVTVSDGYDETPLYSVQRVWYHYAHLMPDYMISYSFAFMHVLSRHAILPSRHRALLLQWKKRVEDRKRAAVRKIEAFWIEVMLSPYTEVGRRTLHRMSQGFDQAAALQATSSRAIKAA